MPRTRKRHKPDFKAKITFEVPVEDRSSAKFAQLYRVLSVQISNWKDELFKNVAPVLESTTKDSDANGLMSTSDQDRPASQDNSWPSFLLIDHRGKSFVVSDDRLAKIL